SDDQNVAAPGLCRADVRPGGAGGGQRRPAREIRRPRPPAVASAGIRGTRGAARYMPRLARGAAVRRRRRDPFFLASPGTAPARRIPHLARGDRRARAEAGTGRSGAVPRLAARAGCPASDRRLLETGARIQRGLLVSNARLSLLSAAKVVACFRGAPMSE